jgi:thiamine-monophosphate kinase
MFENASRTELTEMGEFGLIQHLAQHFESSADTTQLGIGDDCTVIQRDEHSFSLISTELYLEGVHFDLTFHPLKHLGYKLVTAGVSDILAMNGKPEQVLISIGLSNRFSLEAVEELYAGVRLACDKYKVDLVGGDTTTSRSGLVLNITAVGSVSKSSITYRKGNVKPNDLLVVTGDLGGGLYGFASVGTREAGIHGSAQYATGFRAV